MGKSSSGKFCLFFLNITYWFIGMIMFKNLTMKYWTVNLNANMLSDETANLWVFDPNVNSWAWAIAANIRTKANYAHLNIIPCNSGSWVTVTTVSSIFNDCAEHSCCQNSPERSTLFVTHDAFGNLHEILRQWSIVNSSPASNNNIVTGRTNSAASWRASCRQCNRSNIRETFQRVTWL